MLYAGLHDYLIHSFCSRFFFYTDEFDLLLSYFLFMNETVYLWFKANKFSADMALALVLHFPKKELFLDCCEGNEFRGNQ